MPWIFIFWVHRWDLDHLLNHLWLRFFMRMLGWYLISLHLRILKRLLQSSHCVMPSALAICFIYMLSSILVPYSYIGKVIWCGIFWWFYWSPGSLSSHSSYFFEQVHPPFYILDYCPHILGMLGSNHSCICHSFPTWWSPYSSGCSNTCWDWHFPIPDNIMRCHSPFSPGCPLLGPTLWKPSGLV